MTPAIKKTEIVKVKFEIENIFYDLVLKVEINSDGDMLWTVFDVDTEHRKLLDTLLDLHYDYEITDLINKELEKNKETK